ncbi:hypothetical protein E8E13_010058 [Curvularia kusanoi]|uniref:Carboxylic ester hydrolase n=1 Tax=Curvularia kusanoi TaxID=90978 RepID=A0A9P4TMF6_CURKU|nr:hypothetical protein E8E13_010058 [Curvularia kusanoi]
MKVAALLSLLPLVFAAPAHVEKRAGPTVVAPSPQATVLGKSVLNVDSFNAIPYAQPPVGQLRLKPPQSLTSSLGTIDGTGVARACPQFYFSVDTAAFPTNIIGTVTAMYDGTSIVADSVAQGKPIIFVAVNYRVGGFGFLPGKEVLADGSANLGLLDQRLGLQWVADNIAAFGGDPDKVTIWGESAGAISVMDQMLLYDGDNTYKGKPLFRAGIMNSGSIVPADPVDCPKGQLIYDTVVKAADCSSASDTLACLRQVPYTKLLQAMNSVPGILGYFTVNLSYLPRPDGTALTQSPELLVSAGKYAAVPFIVGDQEDEGTLFGLFTPNLTTTAEVSTYFSSIFFNNASPSQIDQLVGTYQTITEDGSPFRTGLLNNWYPQFKRVSAILGDLTFILTRRVFLETAAAVKPAVKSWSYLATYDYGTPILGTFHASDILQVFYGVLPNNAAKSIRGYYYNFIYNLDPNVGVALPNWPQWSEGQQLIEFKANSNGQLTDNFRADSYAFLKANVGALRV